MDEPVKHTLSFSKDVLQLGVHKIDDYYEIYMADDIVTKFVRLYKL